MMGSEVTVIAENWNLSGMKLSTLCNSGQKKEIFKIIRKGILKKKENIVMQFSIALVYSYLEYGLYFWLCISKNV